MVPVNVERVREEEEEGLGEVAHEGVAAEEDLGGRIGG